MAIPIEFQLSCNLTNKAVTLVFFPKYGGSCKMTSSILRKTTLFAKDIYLREKGVISPCPNYFYMVCYALSILYLHSLLVCYKDKYGFYNNIIFFIPLNGRWRRWWAYHYIINLINQYSKTHEEINVKGWWFKLEVNPRDKLRHRFYWRFSYSCVLQLCFITLGLIEETFKCFRYK